MTRLVHRRLPGPVLFLMAAIVAACGVAGAARGVLPASCQPGASPNPPPSSVIRACLALTAPNEKVQVEKSDDGVFTLQSPFTGVDIKKPTLCGTSGCIYHHWNWLSGEGAVNIVSGCNGNDPTCTVRLDSPGWSVVYVELDDNNKSNEKGFVLWRPEGAPTGKAALSVAVNEATPGVMTLGAIYVIRVTVTARAGDFSDVSLGSAGLRVTGARYQHGAGLKTYTSSGRQIVVTEVPPLASGFPLPAGTTRTFDFKIRAHSGGPAVVSATARGAATSGASATATGSTRVEVEQPASTLSRGGATPIIISGVLRTSAMPAVSVSHW